MRSNSTPTFYAVLLVQVVVLTAGLLSGCASQPEVAEEQPVAVVPAPVAEPTEEQKRVNRMLGEADYALSLNRLLNPIADNAFDRYKSVLLIDPENEHAKNGLHVIAMRFVEMAKQSAGKGNLRDAQNYMSYAKSIENSPMVQDAERTLKKQAANVIPEKPYQAGANEVVLDAKQVQAKDAALTPILKNVAQKAKDTDQFVLIIARSDVEGRWIYQQLRNAVPGYLVRGDIKIGQPVRVKLVQNLE